MFRNGKVVIQGIECGGLYEMVGTMETPSTVVSASTSTSDMQPKNFDKACEASGTIFDRIVFVLAGDGRGTVALCEALVGGVARGDDVDRCIEITMIKIGLVTGVIDD